MSALAQSIDATTTIGRFVVERTLGKGAQGAVFLAYDPHLERRVAIKAIGAGATADKIRSLLAEARVVSRFNHPNIVTVYDAIEHEDTHYLVLEYVEGVTLAQLLRKEGALDPLRAVRLASQIADGLAYAHGKQIIHLDIKPANIMIAPGDVARIMDFGIAAAVGDTAPADSVQGTLRYMAPERLARTTARETSDIFSLGMVLYEMLTGRPAVNGNNPFEIMHKIANEQIAPPSRAKPDLDERLDHLVLKAVAKNDSDRYATAAAMKQALDTYLAPAPVEPASAEGPGGALEFLLRRMRHKSNFPALSQTISTINRIAGDSDESVQVLSAALLKDFALTNKLLRLVNSPTYGQFGGNISTISRAVMILGFNAVRDLAITLILFEHLQNKAQASLLKDDMIASYFTGIMAHRIAARCGVGDSEEGFICGVFHHLGKLLATYYFYDESAEIARRVENGETDEHASRAVLGISHEELGIGIARSWNLPEKIVSSMGHLPPGTVHKAVTPADRLKVAANFADALCKVASESNPARKTADLNELNRRFKATVHVNSEQLEAIVEDSVKEFRAESTLFVSESNKSRVIKSIVHWSSKDEAEAAQGATSQTDAAPGATDSTIDDVMNRTLSIAAGQPEQDNVDSAATLTAGIRDITNALVADFNLNDVLRIILETMYRGMNFSQVLLCTRDARSQRLVARFGFGARIEEYLKNFAVPLGERQNVFQIALEKNADLYIADTHAGNIASRIPPWFHEKIHAPAFLLLPLVINQKIIGLFYADRDNPGELTIEPEQLRLLKTLRNQAVLAIRQKY